MCTCTCMPLRPPITPHPAASACLQSHVHMHLPAEVGDYTDFYTSQQHAINAGEIMRGKGTVLNDNW